MNSLNTDMYDHWTSPSHPDALRADRVIAPECYLASEPQAYLALLLEAVRPDKTICHTCKARCLEALVRAASSDRVYWNTKPHVLYPGETAPTHSRLAARLSMMGLDASNNFGLDLSDDHLLSYFEPRARELALFHDLAEPLAKAARYLCDFVGAGHLGDKLEYMILSAFPVEDLVFGRHPGSLVLLIGKILSRPYDDNHDNCCSSCPIYSPLLLTTTTTTTSTTSTGCKNNISPRNWPSLVLEIARGHFSQQISAAWTDSITTATATNNSTTPRSRVCPLSHEYTVPLDPSTSWIRSWSRRFPGTDIDETETETVTARLLDTALTLYLSHEFLPAYSEFAETPGYKFLAHRLGPSCLRDIELDVDDEDEDARRRFLAQGGSLLYTGIGMLPIFASSRRERKRTLRFYRNPANRRFWECEEFEGYYKGEDYDEDDGDDEDDEDADEPRDAPHLWARLT